MHLDYFSPTATGRYIRVEACHMEGVLLRATSSYLTHTAFTGLEF